MRQMLIVLALLCGAASAYPASPSDMFDKLCSKDGKHVVVFTIGEGYRLDGKLLPAKEITTKVYDDGDFELIWRGRHYRDYYCP